MWTSEDHYAEGTRRLELAIDQHEAARWGQSASSAAIATAHFAAAACPPDVLPTDYLPAVPARLRVLAPDGGSDG